ncbi:TPA: motility associated factor glycosyltransferase family protein [Campylobacter jejuni]|nr:motility associated factor glycosyltransferase family protein [Campylobacter jejuni]ECL2207759.1 motility associated factor glycosyltransferase family protein [Campylobacter jejuni]ECO3398413.1 motility associated factor glycosyltransferase family protein [Campylobacter jejuni]ECO3608787.1 motility associated factor glycosyltransferase family protein [Campylobacter jejuni]ECO5613422.1 motility associated factor glycosyltransferase family protein [Campylobacter jejuni]
MKFNQNQIKLFNRNINALNNTVLKESLKQIKSSKFELILGKDNLDINLKNTSDNTFLYKNAIDELNSMLNIYNDKYLLYPVLYFYGFGNGILFKALLQNKNHQHIVVFEKELEIIKIMLHLMDFSQELKENKLIILDVNSLEFQDYYDLCSSNPFFQFSRTYFLELSSDFYEKDKEEILNLNNNLMEKFKNAVLLKGNDSKDILQGIEQLIYNLPKIITHTAYQDLLKKRENLSDTAIIVSTGPSLTKQLPILKKYANKATIISADSSYPILAKHDIKPDYVVSLERILLTSEFFNNNFGDFDKDILFITTHLTHPQTIKNLEKNNRNFMLAYRGSEFIKYLKIKNFGELSEGHSVANVAYGLAVFLRHKNIIFIGQDLAYSNDGLSHTKDYRNLNKHKGHYERDFGHFRTIAYGGIGFVESSFYWSLFRFFLEKRIHEANQLELCNTYNCTEGGARIEGAIEKPFKETCETLLKNNLNKNFPKIDPLSSHKQNELLLKCYCKIIKSINHCKTFKKELLKSYNHIQESFSNLNLISNLDEGKEILNYLIQEIDKIKFKLEDEKNMLDLYEILGPILTQFELNIAKIYILNPKTSEDSYKKSLLWVKEHIEFFKMIYIHIEAQEKALIKNIAPLENELTQRNLEKYKRKINAKYNF